MPPGTAAARPARRVLADIATADADVQRQECPGSLHRRRPRVGERLYKSAQRTHEISVQRSACPSWRCRSWLSGPASPRAGRWPQRCAPTGRARGERRPGPPPGDGPARRRGQPGRPAGEPRGDHLLRQRRRWQDDGQRRARPGHGPAQRSPCAGAHRGPGATPGHGPRFARDRHRARQGLPRAATALRHRGRGRAGCCHA